MLHVVVIDLTRCLMYCACFLAPCVCSREFLLSDSYWTDSEHSRSNSGTSSRGGSFATIDTDPSVVDEHSDYHS